MLEILTSEGGFVADPGQVLFDTEETHYWTVPEGVYSISAVLVGPGGFRGLEKGAIAAIKRGGNMLVYAEGGGVSGGAGSPITGNIGGGNGGNGHSGFSSRGGGGGGAGGYSGNGGDGEESPTAGTGGAGGGGDTSRYNNQGGGGGGGVGLFGEGASGASGTDSDKGGKGGSGGADAPHNPGTGYGDGGAYGGGNGGGVSINAGGAGGGLRYINDLKVTPGEQLEISIVTSGSTKPGKGAVRIIWPGNERYFPSTRTMDE